MTQLYKNKKVENPDTMRRENRQVVTDEPVEVQDSRRTTDQFRGIYGIYLKLMQKNRRMSTCNRLNLQTLGSQPTILPKILPNHCQTLQASISFGENKAGGGEGLAKLQKKPSKTHCCLKSFCPILFAIGSVAMKYIVLQR